MKITTPAGGGAGIEIYLDRQSRLRERRQLGEDRIRRVALDEPAETNFKGQQGISWVAPASEGGAKKNHWSKGNL